MIVSDGASIVIEIDGAAYTFTAGDALPLPDDDPRLPVWLEAGMIHEGAS